MHEQLAGIGIGRHIAVGVTHQHQIAVTLELVAGIGDDAIVGGLDRRAFRHRQIDAVVLGAVRLAAEARDDAALHRPTELRHAARGLGFLGDVRRGHTLRLGRGLGDARGLGRNAGDGLYRLRVRTRDLGRCRLRTARLGAAGDLLVTGGNGHAVADAELGIGADAVVTRERGKRHALTASDADQRIAGHHHMHVAGSARRGCLRRTHGRRRRDGHVGMTIGHPARNDQALAGLEIARVLDVVDLHDRGRRHVMLARDRGQRLAATDRDRLPAVPGPVTRRLRRRNRMRRDRTGDVATAHGRPIGAQALRAAGDAAGIGGDGGGLARRRQRLRHHARGRRRALGDRAGHFRLLRLADSIRCGWNRSAPNPNNRRRQQRPAREWRRAAKRAN